VKLWEQFGVDLETLARLESVKKQVRLPVSHEAFHGHALAVYVEVIALVNKLPIDNFEQQVLLLEALFMLQAV